MSESLYSTTAARRLDVEQPAAPRLLRELYFPKPLAGVIRRERARADRQGSRFSLVLLRLAPTSGRFAALRLSRLAMRTIRATDEVGLQDRNTVCVVLPETTGAGAQVFISRINEASRARGLRMVTSLYCYPSEHFDSPEASDEDIAPQERSFRTNRIQFKTEAARQTAEVDALPMERLLSRPAGRMKRSVDIALAGVSVVLASPLLLAIAAAIRLSDTGPVFYCQYRAGLGGRPFRIYKFRTMRVDADKMRSALTSQSEQDGPAFKMTRDPRVTRFGRLLRKTSLDELPQLLNVLKGEMSLVGPRPLPIEEQAACDPWHRARLDVMPGLTCVWQVKGRSRVSFDDWMRMDLSYARNSWLLDDLKLIVQTIPAVLLRRGAK